MHGNHDVDLVATIITTRWQLPSHFLVAMLHFSFGKHMATGVDTTWQLQFNPHGNFSCCHMAITLHYTWQLQLPPHGNSLILHLHFTFYTLSLTQLT
jgi:hypothetical protein